MTFHKKFWLSAVLAFGFAAVFGAVLGRIVPLSGGVEDPAMILPLAFLGVVGVLACTVLWWKRTDDLQKQAQMVSWWWGGSAGAILMLVTLAVMTGTRSELSLGAGYLFLAQFAGMSVVWIAWKLRGRGLAE